jgi:arginine exporter protein ArgO
MTLKARRNSSLLGNSSISKFLQQQTRDTTEEEFLEVVFSMPSVPMLSPHSYLYFFAVVGLACLNEPESHSGGNICNQ